MSCICNHRISKASTSQSVNEWKTFDQTSKKQLKRSDTTPESPTLDVQMSSCQELSLVTQRKSAGIGTPAITTTAQAAPRSDQHQGRVMKSCAVLRLRTILLSHWVGHFLRVFKSQTATLLSSTISSRRVTVELLLYITYAHKHCKIPSCNSTGYFLTLLHFLTRFRSLDSNPGCFPECSKSQSWECYKSLLPFLCYRVVGFPHTHSWVHK